MPLRSIFFLFPSNIHKIASFSTMTRHCSSISPPAANNKHIYIVDCGSRSSRVWSYERDDPLSGATLVMELGALHLELAEGRGSNFVDELLTSISEKHSDNDRIENTQISIIGTGGIRNAIQEATVFEKDLDSFQSLLQSQSPCATYETLNGFQEAALERRACLYALDAFNFGGHSSYTSDQVTVISMGGASFQVSTANKVLSVEAGIKYVFANGETVEFLNFLSSNQSPIKAVKKWTETTVNCLKEYFEPEISKIQAEKKKNVLFAGIGTTYWAAHDCDIANRFIKVQDATEKINLKINEMLANDIYLKKLKEETGKEQQKIMEEISRLILLREILQRVCSDDATIIFRRRWINRTKDVTTNLPFGKFLEITSKKN